MINICIPVLRRYDMLRALLKSLQTSETKIDGIYIIDNGQDEDRLYRALLEMPTAEATVKTPEFPMGVAESWNWFIKNVPEERIISNDDIQFAPDSVAKIVNTPGDLVWAGHGFSCFLIRDSCIEKLGYFDETISPGYGYYEDEDYLQRLDGRGTRAPSAIATNVDAGLGHAHSATLRAATHEQIMAHHTKFLIAQGNYARKWGVKF